MSLTNTARCVSRKQFVAKPQCLINISRDARHFASNSTLSGQRSARAHKVVVVGGGAAGLSASHQLLRTGRFAPEEIAIVDPAEWHDYQPGWTLVGGGIKTNRELRRPMADLIDPKIKFYNDSIQGFEPDENQVSLSGSGTNLGYEHLVVAPGIKIDYNSVKGLPEALADPSSLVSTIYGYDSSEKVFGTVQKLEQGNAIFTHPAGPIKCAGAPQKMMWMALDYWKRANRYNNTESSPIKISFATGLPVMFGVPKYNKKLTELQQQRGVEGLFQHDLVSIDSGNRATFARPDGKDKVTRRFEFLHAVPKMGPHTFIKESPLADTAGFVDVDQATTRHIKYHNIWSIGDASSLPTSKTAAAITSQVPVLTKNLTLALDKQEPSAAYDGYASCPLITDYDRVLLAEFLYGGVPKETFSSIPGLNQGEPQRAFFTLKKHFFPWVYYKSMVKGTWGGPNGWLK